MLAVDVTAAGVVKGAAQVAGSYYFMKDALGTVRSVASSSGAVAQNYIYSAYLYGK
jgi:hypothetical protein